MSWIKIIKYEEADSKLKRMYDRVKSPEGHIDNMLAIHSLRPHSLLGHMTLYKNVLHHANNTLPKWYLEAIGVYISYLNGCDYCVKHHFEGFRRLVDDDNRAELFLSEVKSGDLLHFLILNK
jgi:AhpD family alkylhydroperoxidase